MKKQTQAIHLEYERRDAYDSLSVPVYNTLAYEFDNAAVMAEAFTDKIKAPDYSRVENPTVTNLERRVAALTDAAHATAFNSGMAAISNTLMALAAQGKNIVTSKHLFGNTYALLVATLRRFGVKVRLRDLTNIEAVREAIDDDTCCVFLEILTNPQLPSNTTCCTGLRKLPPINSTLSLFLDKEIAKLAATSDTPSPVVADVTHNIFLFSALQRYCKLLRNVR